MGGLTRVIEAAEIITQNIFEMKTEYNFGIITRVTFADFHIIQGVTNMLGTAVSRAGL